MSDICSAIHDDIKKYRRLCDKYGEQVVYDRNYVEDCYVKHADKLIRREEKERDKIERSYCLICREEIMTESGQLCQDCVDKAVKRERKGKNGKS